MADTEVLEKLTHELRRGAIVLAVLNQLRQEHYGYSLRKALSHAGLMVEEGTLYPLIRRLEKQSLLTSEWREEAKRKKRFYRLSKAGEQVLQGLMHEWFLLNGSIEEISNVSLSGKDHPIDDGTQVNENIDVRKNNKACEKTKAKERLSEAGAEKQNEGEV